MERDLKADVVLRIVCHCHEHTTTEMLIPFICPPSRQNSFASSPTLIPRCEMAATRLISEWLHRRAFFRNSIWQRRLRAGLLFGLKSLLVIASLCGALAANAGEGRVTDGAVMK